MAKAFVEISLKIDNVDRPSAAAVYTQYKEPFLSGIKGALSKELLVRNEDVQVLHGFETIQDAEGYLTSKLFTDDVVVALKPYLKDTPDVRIYAVA